MGGGVTDQIQSIRVFGRDDGKMRIVFDAMRGVDQTAFGTLCDTTTKRGTRQTSTDRLSNLSDRDRSWVLTLRPVGERN
jgi:hypothetical protein